MRLPRLGWFTRRRLLLCGLTGLLLVGMVQAGGWIWDACDPFPTPRLNLPESARLTDRTGTVLLRRVGVDDQWRFPISLEQCSPWIISATLAAEDARFWEHSGVDYWATLRAAGQLVSNGRAVSGASTLTMQVVRMTCGRAPGFLGKLQQMFRARQLERLRTKEQLLELYLNDAPYGGNIRGVEAAARAYFQKPARELSLSEAALLAGLPQSPTRFRPDRFPERAAERRKFVLRRMQELGHITDDQARLAAAEPIVIQPPTHPQTAFHFGTLASQRRPAGGRTTLDLNRQRVVVDAVQRQAAQLPSGADVAVVVIDIAASEVVALVGSADPSDVRDGQWNGAVVRRSPGSALKPFLYGAAFQSRRLAPDSLAYDGPLERSGWTPQNFDRVFHGEVSVREALQRSLNIPAILVSERLGVERCAGVLTACGLRLPPDATRNSGLTIAVGGVEVTLLDLTNAYATLSRAGRFARCRFFTDEPLEEHVALDRDVCLALDEILGSQHRAPAGWDNIPRSEQPWMMWKTGTSSGRRDAWALGHNRRFAIGVWVGHFSGQGQTAFVGHDAAEPLLAELFLAAEFRQRAPSPPPQPWSVEQPLRLHPDRNDSPRITHPAEGDRYWSAGNSAHVPVVAQDLADAQWFLNGRLLPESPQRLSLPPGQYELRAVLPAGTPSAVRFMVQ